ncbi:MAG: IS3 family transposase [Janthinobacterium lividum]
MGLARSTYHDGTCASRSDDEIVGRIRAIGEEFEAYGYRRICTELGHQGLVVNSKKVRRLMREHDLQPDAADDTSPQPTATTSSRSTRTWPPGSRRVTPISSGLPTSPTSRSSAALPMLR